MTLADTRGHARTRFVPTSFPPCSHLRCAEPGLVGHIPCVVLEVTRAGSRARLRRPLGLGADASELVDDQALGAEPFSGSRRGAGARSCRASGGGRDGGPLEAVSNPIERQLLGATLAERDTRAAGRALVVDPDAQLQAARHGDHETRPECGPASVVWVCQDSSPSVGREIRSR
jgi:hypothetical protein